MRTGFRRPRPDGADETHQLTHMPRDFEKIENESCTAGPSDASGSRGDAGSSGPHFEFTLHPGDLRSPLTEWFESEEGVIVDYHTDLQENPKGRYRLRARDRTVTEEDGWTEDPIRLVMTKVDG